MNDGWGISCEIALIWMSFDFTDDQSTLVQVMAWCHQAPSHYLGQCWPRSLMPYGVTRPQFAKTKNTQTLYHRDVSIHIARGHAEHLLSYEVMNQTCFIDELRTPHVFTQNAELSVSGNPHQPKFVVKNTIFFKWKFMCYIRGKVKNRNLCIVFKRTRDNTLYHWLLGMLSSIYFRNNFGAYDSNSFCCHLDSDDSVRS